MKNRLFAIAGSFALAAVIVTPLTVNILCFHLFLDHSFFSPAAAPAWVLLVTNAYFLWLNWEKYEGLWK